MTNDRHNEPLSTPPVAEGTPVVGFADFEAGNPTSPDRLAAAEFIAHTVAYAAHVTATIEPSGWTGWFTTNDKLPDTATPPRPARQEQPSASRIPPRDLRYIIGLTHALGMSQNPRTQRQIEGDLRKAIDDTFGAEGAA